MSVTAAMLTMSWRLRLASNLLEFMSRITVK
jgi:hypothetical protein